MSISASSVLVEQTLRVWTGNKVDKVATQKVTEDNSAVSNAARVKKNLFSLGRYVQAERDRGVRGIMPQVARKQDATVGRPRCEASAD